jgi:hypothetical protein
MRFWRTLTAVTKFRRVARKVSAICGEITAAERAGATPSEELVTRWQMARGELLRARHEVVAEILHPLTRADLEGV